MSGYTLEELRTLHMSALEAVETRSETEQHTEKMKREGADRFQSRHRRKDGSSFPVEVSTTYIPGRDLLIGFVRDLTDKTEAESALRESEAHHRELIEILGEGVAATDLHETIIMANPEAARIFGVGVERLIGQNLRAFMDDADWRQIRDQTTRRVDGQTDSYQTHIRRADGTRRTLQLTATPRRDAAGQVTGSLAVFRDITDEIRTQEALRLSQKMESLGNLAGGLAHDMNNVLGAILGLATTNLDLQPEGSRLHSTFHTITRACLRGRNMVKSLLDFARKDMTGERSVSLNGLVQEEARLLERTIPANVAIRLDLDPAVGTILGDPDALSLVLMNLCVNAVDAMPEGGSLTLGTRNQPDGRVLLTVTDTGSGMSPETLEHAIEPFYTTKPQGKGTGLGLSLAYSTVKAHHGDLSIQSRLGQGTTVEMRFQSVLTQTEPPRGEEDETNHASSPCRILLVDDDELIQSSVSAQLEVMGHEATVTSSGEQAMDLVNQGLRPDVVILDMNMPGWGGARTLPRLRAALPEVPILLSTGRTDQRALDLARAIEGVTILAKPFSFRELQATFAAILPKP
jgi:PAS domain S-box-containing protein